MASNSLMLHKLPKGNICSNCGIQGHHYKQCMEPVTSYGIIAFRITDDIHTMLTRASMLPQKNIEFLLVQRRDSIGFIELLRAKYKLTDIAYIRQQIAGMTPQERQFLLDKSFDELWVGLWGKPTLPENRQYKQEYELAKQKFEVLKTGFDHNSTKVTLEWLIQSTPVLYDSPEWGFPKGRRNTFETNYKCAVREFCEETGLETADVKIFENIEPICETFYGNNNIHYSHVYYVGHVRNSLKLEVKRDDPMMTREIGDIGWFTLDAALAKIRPSNSEKREALLRISKMLKVLSPLCVAANSTSEIEPHAVNRNHRNESTGPWNRNGGGGRSRGGSTPSSPPFGFIEETKSS